MYVLKKVRKNLFVSKPGREKSYTSKLEYAQKFNTKEEAIQGSCILNEYPIDVGTLL